MTDDEYETWLIEVSDQVIGKMAARVEPSPIEKLCYCLWVADYGMRNAGDLVAAADLYPPFATKGEELAKLLDMPLLAAAFALPRELLEDRYYSIFGSLAGELFERQVCR